MSNKTIELNGKHYDAISGAPVKIEVKVKSKEKAPKVAAVSSPVKRTVSPARPHKPQASKTLMRSSVKKPAGHGQIKKFADTVEPTYVELPVKKSPVAHSSAVVARPAETSRTNVFEDAIAKSHHHQDVHAVVHHHKKKVRSNRLQLAAGLAAFLVLAGFAMYQNTPGMQLSIAGKKVGLTTAGADYQAAGFAFRGVTTEGNKRIVGLVDDGGNTYHLVQQKTNWDDKAMVQAVSAIDASGSPNYTVVGDGDAHQLYRFSNGTVTWIQNQVLYQLDDASGLSDDQLQSLAANS